MKDLYRDGEAFTLRLITGTVCPGWNYRTEGYNKEWHETGNPGAAVADCLGTGIAVLDRVTTDVSLKARVIPIGNISLERLPKEWVSAIGNIDQEILYFVGSVNVSVSQSTGVPTFYSLKGLSEQVTEVIYDSKTYKIRRVESVINTAEKGLWVRHA